jgi:hypothetical protein
MLEVLNTHVSKDVAVISQAILILYGLLSATLLCVVFYFVFIGGAVRLRHRENAASVRLRIYLLPALFVILFLGVYALDSAHLLPAANAFFIGALVIFCAYYFKAFRPLLRSDDFRVQYTAILWAALTAATISALVLLASSGQYLRIEKQFVVSYESIIQASSIIVSALGIAFTYVMKSEQGQRTTQQKLYQELELQSISLFRFECDHKDLVAALWFSKPPPAGQIDCMATFTFQLRQYACQMLNLFEMALRFRLQGILPSEVFGSWLIWMWEMCEARRFQEFWLDDDGLPFNYIGDFREIMTLGVELSLKGEGTADERRQKFFHAVANQINCREIDRWLARKEIGRLEKLRRLLEPEAPDAKGAA